MSNEEFDPWLDAFFASYYERRPVNATFAGVHAHDERLPDYSTVGVDDSLQAIDDLRSRVEQFDPSNLSQTQRLDRKLAAGALEIQRWELESGHFHESNPSLYTGEAIFGFISLFLTDYAPLSERVDAAKRRLRSVPDFLDTATQNLELVPEFWAWRARNEIDAARDLFGEDIQLLVNEKDIDDNDLLAAASEALAAFEHFDDHLDTVEKTTDHAAGEDGLGLVVKRGHFRDESLDEIRSLGCEHLEQAKQNLAADLGQFDADSPSAALKKLQGEHPSAAEYYDRHAELWDECRELANGRFIDWPDYPLEFVARPKWVRRAAQNLYFLFYRAPAPYDDIEPVEYLLEPVDPEMDEETKEERLHRWNTAQIKLNHVAHHGGLGHHVQNHRAYNETDSRIGEMAAVDTASRISLCCGGTMAEGWSLYASELLSETDFLTPLEAYSLHQTRRRMATRAIVDVDLHRGDVTAEEAVDFYCEEAGMSETGAKYEVAKNSMFPGMALMYVLGIETVYNVRSELEQAMGNKFDLPQFHEELLSSGSVPVSLKAAQLREKYVQY